VVAVAREHWAAVIADFRREYRIGLVELEGLPAVEFVALLLGLSAGSGLKRAVAETVDRQKRTAPATVEDAAEYVARLRRRGLDVTEDDD
jgi:hypothetical protein